MDRTPTSDASAIDDADAAAEGVADVPTGSRRRRMFGRPPRLAHAGQNFLLALICYVPALLAHPGKLPSDTKLYLYFDPGYLLRTGTQAWDTTQYGGWVPHQQIAYLWPAGPWYWIFDKLGVPDWIAQRLWIATLLLCAGLGARWLAKMLGLASAAAMVTALFYMLSPYVLPYISRTSVMLLPFAGLCWLVGLTIKASTSSSWRYPALFALVMFSVAAVNFTAIVMIAPGPILWLIDAVWRRTVTWRKAVLTALKLGALSVIVSLWWIVILSIQSKHGANVLGFSETLQAVSLTSLSTETLRGLGYWLFYIRDLGGPATSAAALYLTSTVLVLVSLVVLIGGVAGLSVTSWAARRYATLLVLAGTILAVSVHPIQAASPLMTPLADNARSGLALSMRSSTRAIPLSVLGLALGWGALVTVLTRLLTGPSTKVRLPGPVSWRRIVVPVAAGLLAVANLPALFNGDIVDPAISHDEHPPAGWLQASAALSATPTTARVLEVPGAPFGAYRWGFTVDPPLPGLTSKPLLNRDLLPLGSPGAMDLQYALDNRFQAGTIEAQSIAPVARLLGADTIFSPDDVAFDRFRTPRPEVTEAILKTPNVGLGTTASFGPAAANTPLLATLDEDEVSNRAIGEPLPTATVTQVQNANAVIRAKTDEVVLVGSGDGVVDAAAAGLLDGSELVEYAGDIAHPVTPTAGVVSNPSRVIVTDSNRDRAEQWRSSRDTRGFTEDGTVTGGVSILDTADARLAVFPNQTAADETIAQQRGGLTATASAYGEPYAYRPEDRAAMAVDGDPSTAWLVADRAPADGSFITVVAPAPIVSLSLLQPNSVAANRWITGVEISFDDSAPQPFALDESSKRGNGQTVMAAKPFTVARITITSATGDALSPFGQSAVGFASITAAQPDGTAVPPTTEVVRPPTTATDLATSGTLAGVAVDYVFTRDRTSPTDRWRSDPEAVLIRDVVVGTATTLTPRVTVRLDQRAADSVIATLFGMRTAEADNRLTGVAADGGYAAIDDNPETAWVTSFGRFPGQPTGGTIDIPLSPGAVLDHLQIAQSSDQRLATIRSITISTDRSGPETLQLEPAGATLQSTVRFPAVTGATVLHLTVASTDAKTTIDRRSGELTAVPVAISDISGPGIVATRFPTTVDTGCRTDLLSLGGAPVGIEIRAATRDLLNGDAVEATLCGPALGAGSGLAGNALPAGTSVLASAPGVKTGVDIDRVVLISDSTAPTRTGDDANAPTVTSKATHDGSIVTVSGCASGCWLVNGEGYELGWRASVGGASLGDPTQVDGGFNGWRLPPGAATQTVTLSFGPQRTLDEALLVTLLGVIGCLALAVFAGSKRSTFSVIGPVLITKHGAPRSIAAIAATWLAVAGAAAILISPNWGAIALALSGVLLWVRRRPHVLAIGGLVGVVAIAARLLWILRHVRPAPDPNWTFFFESLHRPGLLVVVVLCGSALLDDAAPAVDAANSDHFPAGGTADLAALASSNDDPSVVAGAPRPLLPPRRLNES